MTDAQSRRIGTATEVAKPTIHQVASIVKDLDAGVAHLQETMGWGPWDVYEYVPGRLRELTVRGEPAEFTWIGAEVEIGPESTSNCFNRPRPTGSSTSG